MSTSLTGSHCKLRPNTEGLLPASVRTAQQQGGSVTGRIEYCTVRVFRQAFTSGEVVGSHAWSLEAIMRVTNAIPLVCPLSYRLIL
jgi:hypothetical protein